MSGFDVMFEAGHKFAGGTVEPRPAGTIAVPSGRVVVCDPSGAEAGTRPLARAVPPGTYPVTISVGRLDAIDERRVAAAMVRFSARPIARWEAAACDGDDPETLTAGQFFGYGVDGGVGCFVDAVAAAGLTFVTWEGKVLSALLAADPTALCGAAEVAIEGGNLVAFTTGAGDGTYASFWGLDAQDEPVVLVTEFRIVGGEETRGRDIIRATWPQSAPRPVRAATVRALSSTPVARAATAKPARGATAKPVRAAAAKPVRAATAKCVRRREVGREEQPPRSAGRSPSPRPSPSRRRERSPRPRPSAALSPVAFEPTRVPPTRRRTPRQAIETLRRAARVPPGGGRGVRPPVPANRGAAAPGAAHPVRGVTTRRAGAPEPGGGGRPRGCPRTGGRCAGGGCPGAAHPVRGPGAAHPVRGARPGCRPPGARTRDRRSRRYDAALGR